MKLVLHTSKPDQKALADVMDPTRGEAFESQGTQPPPPPSPGFCQILCLSLLMGTLDLA